jgi:hypothetical protein
LKSLWECFPGKWEIGFSREIPAFFNASVMFFKSALEMKRDSRMGRKGDLIKALDWAERLVTDSEGMKRDEISLGSVENGLYFKREKGRMLLLQKA